MSDTPTVHASFTIDRTFDATPDRVFAAFATAEGKARWFSGPPGWAPIERVFDFRVGGRERAMGRWPSGMVTDFDATYFDIVPDRRIVYAYAMKMDEVRISVSLATIELFAQGAGTRMLLTEQGAFVDGYVDGTGGSTREHGTRYLMDQLAASLGG